MLPKDFPSPDSNILSVLSALQGGYFEVCIHLVYLFGHQPLGSIFQADCKEGFSHIDAVGVWDSPCSE